VLDDEFEEFGASGRRWDRAAVLATLDAAPPADMTIEGFSVTLLAEHVALATFLSIGRAPGVPARRALRSSLWVRRDGRWRLRFHQGTPTTEAESSGS
jgi:glyoxylase I family protein